MDAVWAQLLHPVVLIVLLIIISIFFLILMAIFGWDKGKVLLSMSRIEFARGLITYLFAVVTIGTAVVLLVYVLTLPTPGTPGTASAQDYETRFTHGKEILSLLLGVFGAIVGFYFGSEVSRGHEDRNLRIAPVRLGGLPAVSGGTITVNTVVAGGKAPWRYAVVVGDTKAHPAEYADPGGWIVKDVVLPATDTEKHTAVRVVVQDDDGVLREQKSNVVILPANRA